MVLVGSGAPWLCYTITRLWLALWGQLPWRLTRFLRHAHAAGVLRQAGPAYQFRHDMLRTYLADHGPPTRQCDLIVQPSDPTRHRPVLRRWNWWRRLAGVAVAISLLLVAAELIVPTPLRASLHGSADSVSFSVDRTLASISADGTVRLWDPVTGNLRRTLTTDSVYSVYTGEHYLAFSPDGLTLATAGIDAVVSLWDPVTGQLRRPLPTRTDWVSGLAFSPDGSILAVAGGEGSEGVVWLWDPVTGKLRGKFISSTDRVSNPTFSPDGSTLAVLDNLNGVMRLWDLVTGQLRTFPTGSGSTSILAFSPNGSILARISSNGSFLARLGLGAVDSQLWDPTTGQLRHAFTSYSGFTSLAFSPDGSTMAMGERDGHVQLRDSATGQLQCTFIADTGQVGSVAFNPDGSTLASAGGDGVIRLWNVAMLERREPR